MDTETGLIEVMKAIVTLITIINENSTILTASKKSRKEIDESLHVFQKFASEYEKRYEKS